MKNGFTLIKLLVVIAILGIVSTIVIKGVSKNVANQTNTPTVETFYPEPTNYAVDAAGVLTADQLSSLNTKLKALDTDKHQFGIAIVRTLNGLTREEYGSELAKRWKVGKVGRDNGAIIILASEDREVYIAVGYGLEGDLNDAKVGRIIDEYMMSSLKESKWYNALDGGVNGLERNVRN